MPVFLYVLLSLLAVLVILLVVAVIRALPIGNYNAVGNVDGIADSPAIHWGEEDESRAVQRLSRMVQAPTVSPREGEDLAEFYKLHAVMAELFPHVWQTAEKTDLNGNLLFRWKGKDSSRSILLMGHQDVVPALEPDWTYPPYSGTVANGRVFGRGSFDCKCTVMSEFAAVEELILAGVTPLVDVYLACSVNEENSGGGAALTAAYLKEHGVHPELVLDEGGVITENAMPGMRGMCALIGVTEKGYMDVKLTARSAGGHASTPPRNTPLVRLAAFMLEMERTRPFKKEFSPVVEAMFARMAPRLNFPMRLLLGNVWLFRPLLTALLPKISPYGEALLSNTFAFTMSQGSGAANVIPPEAYVVCNLRLLSGHGIKETLAILEKRAKKYGIAVEASYAREASALADINGAAFHYVEACIRACMPDVGIVPYLLMGGTDCREYELVSDCCLRFCPIRVDQAQLASEHSVDENVNASSLAEATEFYKYLIRNYE